MSIKQLQKEIHQWARSKGWWDTKRSDGDIFSNIHSEISEAWEEYRNNNPLNLIYYDSIDTSKPCGIPIELADCVIRILDYCEASGIDLEQAIQLKMKYNHIRPYRHGNKKA